MIRHAISRAVSAATIAVASLFDGGLDKLISSFGRLDADLERYIERVRARQGQEVKTRQASYARLDAVMDSEAAIRDASHERDAFLAAEAARAERIRAKLADFLG